VNKSYIPNQVPDATFQSLGNLGEGFERDLFLRPFNVANIIPRQVGLFSQFFLAETSLLSFGADGFAQKPIDSARGHMHSLESKQKTLAELPTTSWYFSAILCLPFPGGFWKS